MSTVVFPLTSVASRYAPTGSMPSWLRLIAEWNPVAVSVARPCLLTAVSAPLAVAAVRHRSRD
ncbi:MAG: transporter permease [Modestobacter sp.]|jgi:hypothetical protein|nr:transporter permease [Modestobacter sp.]